MSDRPALIAGLSLAIDNHRKWETAERLAAIVKVGKTPLAQDERVKRCMHAGRKKIAALDEIRGRTRLLATTSVRNGEHAKPLLKCVV
jgi:hypothetical protein